MKISSLPSNLGYHNARDQTIRAVLQVAPCLHFVIPSHSLLVCLLHADAWLEGIKLSHLIQLYLRYASGKPA
jgi:hypothetical protein